MLVRVGLGLAVAVGALPAHDGGVASAPPPAAVAAAPAARDAFDARIEELAKRLRGDDAAARRAAVDELVALGANEDAFGALVRRLARPATTRPDTFRKMFLEMWAQVPNWKSGDPMWIRKPEPPWVPPKVPKGQPRPKRPPPHDPEALDWVTGLQELDLTAPALFVAEAPDFQPKPKGWKPPAPKPPKPTDPPPPPPPTPPTAAELAEARAEALETVALLRAVSRAGLAAARLDAVEPLFQRAFTDEGVFRDECGRQIRAMGSYAIPSLVRLMYAKGPPKQRRYASYQLDRMDRAQPSKAISTAPDDRVRAAIIRAYGDERALNAVEAILNQVDASSHRVRNEARAAWLKYVAGKAPPPAPRRHRKLPGGREEVEEKPDYLTYREIATLALQKQLEAINGEPPDPKLGAKELTDQLLAFYDRRRAAEWDKSYDEARAREAAGDWKGAVDGYGWILAHDPNDPRRGQMVRAYLEYAESLRRDGKWAEAAGWFRTAVDLAPDGADAARAGARAALADGMTALGRGDKGPDVAARFRQALALDPTLREASDGLARTQAVKTGRAVGTGSVALGGGLGLAALLALLWRRASRRRDDATEE